MREIALLGSTGSIGTQALDVVRRNPERFRVVALAAGGDNVELLAAQAIEFEVEVVGVARASAMQDLQLAFYAAAQQRGYTAGQYRVPKVMAGPEAASEVAAWPCDVVLNGITGSVGLEPTLVALRAGRTLALANKESLIVGGPLVTALARERPDALVPVDSEHSAIAQCLRAGRRDEIRRLVLTASGGPFLGWSATDRRHVRPEQALSHPTWDMGPVVTVNSATLVNKGLEVIEAHLLFDVAYDDIRVVVHPQSLVHSMVEFVDGATVAQLSPPDMALPIALGLAWPERVAAAEPAMDWSAHHALTFDPLDTAEFPAVALAYDVGRTGATAPAVLNAANEEAVAAFLAGRLRFPEIVDTVAQVVGEHLPDARAAARASGSLTVTDVLMAEAWARDRARALLGDRAEVAR
ncbi:MAG: 1-deoxy-D-xylulose-5-phosphate reductoisomerase [Mycobacteriales bacterium]